MRRRMLSITQPASPAARFGNDAFWSTIGNAVTQGLSFCSTVIVARLLTREEFGQYVFFLSSVLMLTTVAGLGLGVSLSTITAELRESAPDELGRKLAAAYYTGGFVTLCVGAAVFLATALLGDQVSWLNAGRTFLLLAIVTVVVNTASMLQSSELVGYQKFKSLAVAQCLRGIALPPLCAAGAVTLGLSGVILGAAVSTCMGVIVQAGAIRRERILRRVVLVWPGRSDTYAVLSRSIPAFFAGIAQGAGYWGGTAVMAAQRQGGMAAVGAFGAATQVSNIILFLPNIIGQVLMATVANKKASRPDESQRLVRLSFLLNTGAASLLAAIAIVFRHRIALLFGAQYSEASGTIALISVGAVIYVAQSTFSMALIGYSHIRTLTVANTIAASVFVATTAALQVYFPHLGGQCLAWAYIASSTVQLIVNGSRLLAVGQDSRASVLMAAQETSA